MKVFSCMEVNVNNFHNLADTYKIVNVQHMAFQLSLQRFVVRVCRRFWHLMISTKITLKVNSEFFTVKSFYSRNNWFCRSISIRKLEKRSYIVLVLSCQILKFYEQSYENNKYINKGFIHMVHIFLQLNYLSHHRFTNIQYLIIS